MSDLTGARRAMSELSRPRLCESCAYFKPDRAADGDAAAPWARGACWRYPPAVVAGPRGPSALRPPVSASDYCGEWREGGEAYLAARADIDHAGMIRDLTDKLADDAGDADATGDTDA